MSLGGGSAHVGSREQVGADLEEAGIQLCCEWLCAEGVEVIPVQDAHPGVSKYCDQCVVCMTGGTGSLRRGVAESPL